MTLTTDVSLSTIDFTIPEDLRSVVDRVKAYIEEDVVPLLPQIEDPDDLLKSWHLVEQLRERSKARGIFCPHMPEELGGLGIGTLGVALISQELGAYPLASLGMNIMAPDEGNMHTLLEFGTEDQHERFLRPLAEGRVRSCFAMTEPDVASSDPTNLETSAVKDGDDYVINGRKWAITGGIGAAFAITVCKTSDVDGAGHRNYSLIVVPMDTPGVEIEKDPAWTGAHYPGGHPYVLFQDVRVPQSNLIGREGEGFVITQKRLSHGRLAHAMRWIGQAQRALDLSAQRMTERQAFGKDLADHQMLQAMLADSAIDLYASRLMVLHAAWKLQNGLPHRTEISMVKTFVAEALGRVADRAVQIHGAAGITRELPIAQIYADARAARIYDGASEVHRFVVARDVLKLARQGKTTKAACGDLG